MPARASSASSASSIIDSLRCQCGEMTTKLHSIDGMTWLLLAVVTLYIAMVNPSNTPAFFSNTAFKFVLFAFVAVVFVLEGPLVGTMFAIAMALPVVYSSLREGYENPFIENYDDANETEDSKEDDESDGDKEEKHGDNHEKHGDNEKHGDKDKLHEDSDSPEAMKSAPSTKSNGANEHADDDTDGTDDKETSSAPPTLSTASDEPEGAPPVTESWCNFANVF